MASTPQENAAWVAEEGFQFEVWTDDSTALSAHYDALNGQFNLRKTFLLNADGTVALEYTNVNSTLGTHPADVLNDCQLLFGTP